MKRGENLWQRLTRETDLGETEFPGQPVIEIAGHHRVLIESHRGVTEYSRERIRVRVRNGFVCVSGTGLELRCMTRDQLLIRGSIDCVVLQRRDCP